MASRQQDKLHRDHKNAIKAGILLDRTNRAALGEIEMTKEQLAAAKLFLSKTMPDLKATEHSGEVDVNVEGFIFRRPANRG